MVRRQLAETATASTHQVKTMQIIAWGIAIALVLLGFGGCNYLCDLGRAALKKAGKPTEMNVNLPGLIKKSP